MRGFTMVWGRENVSHSISKLLKNRSLNPVGAVHARLATEVRRTDPEIGVLLSAEKIFLRDVIVGIVFFCHVAKMPQI